MSLEALFVEIHVLTAGEVADEFSALFHGLVSGQMGSVVTWGGKALLALLALEGLFTGMDLHVSFKIGDLSERLVASLVGTLVRLIARVDANVLLERRILSERLSTSFVGTKTSLMLKLKLP